MRVPQSFQHVSSGFKSAIKDYYKQKNIEMPIESQRMLANFFAGYKRQYAQMKQEGTVVNVTEGKNPLSFSGYKYIAKRAVTATDDFELAIFAWVFLVLSWNLMARCVSVIGFYQCNISIYTFISCSAFFLSYEKKRKKNFVNDTLVIKKIKEVCFFRESIISNRIECNFNFL